MGRPSKSLFELVQDGTFRARRHHALLGVDELLPWKTLSRYQEAYRAAALEFERRRVAVEFERAIPQLQQRRERAKKPLDELLAGLGPEGSAERVVKLAHRFFRLEDGRRWRLDGWQVDVLQRFLRRDSKGRRIFKVLLLGIPRGNGKTPFVSLLNVEALLQHLRDARHVFQVAGSKEQARVGAEFASGWIYDGDLKEWVSVRSSLTCESSGGEMRVLSSDGRLAHGRKFRRASADELWLFATYREVQSWVALETALHKEADADLIGMTTAGHDLGSLLGEKYSAAMKLPGVEISNDGCLTIVEDPDSGFLMVWYGAPEDADIEDDRVLRACNPLSTLDMSLIRKELLRPGADELEWRRLHLNQWTKVKDSWLPTGVWARIRSEVQIPAGADVCVAVDAALKYDTTAVAWAGRIEDGRVAVDARVWSARDEVAHDVYVPGGRIDNELAADFILDELAERYRVTEVVADPRFFDVFLEKLSRRGLVVAEFAQNSALMADAYQHFYEGATGGSVAHNGNPVLWAHVEAMAAVMTERGWKVYKLRSSQPIDAGVASVMAVERASRYGPQPFMGGVEWGSEDDERKGT